MFKYMMLWRRNPQNIIRTHILFFSLWNFTYLVDQQNLENIFDRRSYRNITVPHVPYLGMILPVMVGDVLSTFLMKLTFK